MNMAENPGYPTRAGNLFIEYPNGVRTLLKGVTFGVPKNS
jgi:hypothetical protein